MKQEKILLRIQQLRRNLAALVTINGSLTSQAVLRASHKLDVAVNAYYRVLIKKNHKRKKGLF